MAETGGVALGPTITEGQRAVRQLVTIGVAVILLVIAGTAGLLTFASHALDELQASEDRALISNTLHRSLAGLASDVTTATVWDQAYEELKPGGDQVWADEEVGTYYANNRGHDATLVLDRSDRPFYAWTAGERTDAANLAALQRDAAPLLRRVRALEASRKPPSPSLRATDPALAETASGVVRSQGAYYLVAVSTVTPENALSPRAPGRGTIVISAQRMDRQLLRTLGEMGIGGPRLAARAPAEGQAIPLTDIDGKAVGSLAWDAKQPGVQVLRTAAPPLLLGFGLLFMAAGGLALLVRRVTGRMDLHEAAHRQAMGEVILARNRAEDANLAKSQFLANMSHEIRTPLNGVLGMADVLSRSSLTADQQDKLHVIRDSGEILLAVLNDLLDLAKIEAGRLDLDIHDFDLAAAVNSAVRPFAGLAAQKDVGFRLSLGEGVAGLWRGDAVRLRQVLANLASNAVKFTSEGEVELSVSVAGEGLAFAVRDTGLGIPADRVGDLFDKFTQADATTTRQFGGTGLGLAICRQLVELMGGAISAISELGVGSTFSFHVPIQRMGDVAQAADAGLEAQAEMAPLRVLAVEDNKTNQLLLTALLGPMGLDIQLAGDGSEAVVLFGEAEWDLILMDIQMPLMNGIEATKAIRLLERSQGRRRTPILALSANVMRDQVGEYLAAGMDGFVAKPINAAELIRAMQAALAPDEAAHAAGVG